MLAASTDNPTALLLLVLVVPLLVALVFAYRRSQRDLAALQRLVHTSPAAAARAVTVLRLKRCADGVLTVVAVTSVIFAAAGVRWGEGMVEDTTTGHEVVVLLDLSRSMSAQDALPSRLGQGLAALDTLLEQLPGTRFALVGFSDAAHLLVPFTDDRQACGSSSRRCARRRRRWEPRVSRRHCGMSPRNCRAAPARGARWCSFPTVRAAPAIRCRWRCAPVAPALRS